MTSAVKNVLAICGSTRKQSSNLSLIKALSVTYADFISVTICTDIGHLPQFNPDEDGEASPASVNTFRKSLRAADGILICTPEYAMGVPGSLKNAIDWTVSSCEFSHKPTALITASSLGHKGHASLLQTLHIIEAGISENMQLVIPFIKTKLDGDTIKDDATVMAVNNVMTAFITAMISHQPEKR